jgi:hypothetical protein
MNCLSHLDRWSEILTLADAVDPSLPEIRSKIGRYIVFAERYQEIGDSRQQYIGSSDLGTDRDQIARAIILKTLGRQSEAHATVHGSWRYLSASLLFSGKHDIAALDEAVSTAVQLHELTSVIKSDSSNREYASWGNQDAMFRFHLLANQDVDNLSAVIQVLKKYCEHKEFTRLLIGKIRSDWRELAEIIFVNSDVGKARLMAMYKPPEDTKDTKLDETHLYCAFVGKRLYKSAKLVTQLNAAQDFVKRSESNVKRLADVQVLVAYLLRKESEACTAANSIRMCLELRPTVVRVFQASALLLGFPKCLNVAQTVRAAYNVTGLGFLRHFMKTAILMTSHTSENVIQSVIALGTKLMTEISCQFMVALFSVTQEN